MTHPLFNRTFERPNLSKNWRCPLCQKPAVRPVVLMPILGTVDGGLVECQQIHADCLEYGVRALVAPLHPTDMTPEQIKRFNEL